MGTAPPRDPPDQTWTYQEIADKAPLLREAIAAMGIRLHRDSALAKLLREAETLARDWEAGRTDGGFRRLIHAAHANRIVDAIRTAQVDPGALECVRRMCAGAMDLSGREPSRGKDALWELDIASFLKRRDIPTEHHEPDLTADFGFGPYPIACKKIYSEKGLEGQVRKGARQLERYGSPGMIAVNLDDLVPDDHLLRSPSMADASDFLARHNLAVIERNRARLQRFIADGRCDCIIFSTTVLADIEGSSTRFNTHTQTTLWSLDSVSPAQSVRLARIKAALEVHL